MNLPDAACMGFFNALRVHDMAPPCGSAVMAPKPILKVRQQVAEPFFRKRVADTVFCTQRHPDRFSGNCLNLGNMTAQVAAGKTALQVYSYEGSNITFSQGENVMVNATQMAKAFGKQPKDFLKSQSTKDFIDELAAVRKILPTELVKVVNGGKSYGTWMHEDVAMEFARWLSPKFAIWCNDRIKELLRSGITSLTASTQSRNDDEVIAHAFQVLNQRLEDKQRELETAHQNLLALQERADQAELYMYGNDDLARYAFHVLLHGKLHTFSQLAPELGFSSASDLTGALCRLGILYHDGSQLQPTEPYAHSTYFSTRIYRRIDAHGLTVSKPYLVVTEMGRHLLHHRLNPDFIPETINQQKGGEQ